MAQQTAIEWLCDELAKNYALNYSIEIQIKREAQIWAQAKQMEKEQIIDAHNNGKSVLPPNENGEQYYNETYGIK